jgi:hypothetical protein
MGRRSTYASDVFDTDLPFLFWPDDMPVQVCEPALYGCQLRSHLLGEVFVTFLSRNWIRRRRRACAARRWRQNARHRRLPVRTLPRWEGWNRRRCRGSVRRRLHLDGGLTPGPTGAERGRRLALPIRQTLRDEAFAELQPRHAAGFAFSQKGSMVVDHPPIERRSVGSLADLLPHRP